MGRLPVRLPSYAVAAGVLEEHADAETVFKGVSSADTYYPYRDVVSAGATIASASITLTKKCLVVVVACVFFRAGGSNLTQIRRGGVNVTKETVDSGGDSNGFHMSLQYASEVLDVGSYTYSLVSSAAGYYSVHGAALKVIAVG